MDHRDAEYLARFSTGPETGGAEVRDHHALIAKTLSPWSIGQSPAFLYGAGDWADEAQTRAGYTPAAYDRLAALKSELDPANLFRHNRNIRPAQA